MTRVLIVGGGILGPMHAWEAVRRGHEVHHLERERQASGATVRNFGLVWVSGRSASELPAALRARELWERIGTDVPAVGFRANGSLTVVRTAAEWAVAEAALREADAADRELELLDAAGIRARNPALRGELLGALWCGRDATVESRVALPPLRAHLAATRRYAFRSGVTVLDAQVSAAGVDPVRRRRRAPHRRHRDPVPRRGARRPGPQGRGDATGAAGSTPDGRDRAAVGAVADRGRRRGQLPLLPRLRRTRAGPAAGAATAGRRRRRTPDAAAGRATP